MTRLTQYVAGCILACSALLPAHAQGVDPFAANNTIYPDSTQWKNKPYRVSNYDYPTQPLPPQPAASTWLTVRPTSGPLTRQTAPAYVALVKQFLSRDIAALINDPQSWSPKQARWFDMPWGGQGSRMSNGKIDPASGREALLGSYTGQILENISYPQNQRPTPQHFQNHAVVYYNDIAGAQLGNIWKNPFKPDLAATQFPEGSMALKVEGVTLTEDQWPSASGPPVLKGSSVSYLYRPSVESMLNEPDPTKRVPVVTPLRFLQMAVRIKDRVASPKTGWVFVAFAYDSRSNGRTVWDRVRPIGAMWGNDPQFARYPNGLGPNGVLTETWTNDSLPDFVRFGLGWGGRLAGPLDVGLRHNVITVSGQRYERGNSFPASSCVSCHSSGQYPFVANLYPSPNMVFPEDGQQFLFFDPGSAQWASWFQNRPGNVAMSGRGRASGIVATDYDMMLTFALSAANGSAGAESFSRPRVHGH